MKTILRLSVYDSPGVLDRIAGLIRRNGYNIKSLNAGQFKSGIAQINIVLGDERIDVGRLGKQLYDINFVSDYKVFSYENAQIRELALIRMKDADFDETYFRGARIIERAAGEVSFEITGSPREIDSLILPVQEKMIDYARSGALAIAGEGTNNA